MSFLSKVFPCLNNDDDPPRVVPPAPTPQNPWTIGPIIGGNNMSQGMPLQPTPNGDGTFYFDFPTAKPGVHGITRPWGPVAAGGTLTLQFKIDGNATFLEVASLDDVQSPGVVRLFLQRSGDNWSDVGAYSSYRFYSQPLELRADGASYQLSVQLSPEVWTNVNGQQDPAGFAAVLADLATVGFGLGGDAAMHGAIAVGQARFTILAFT